MDSGHSFIGVKNISDKTITVGNMRGVAPQQTVTLGTWGNKPEHTGLWYNLESYILQLNRSAYATDSISRIISADELKTLNSYILDSDTHGGGGLGAALDNCSTFAAGAWNSVNPFAFDVFAGIPNTPTALALSIARLPGSEIGAAVDIPWNSLGVWYADGKKKIVRSAIGSDIDVTRITFDELAVGTAVTTQYADKGLLVSGSPGPVISGDGSNPTAPVLSPGLGFSGTIDMEFVSPSNIDKAATVSSVAFDIGYLDTEYGATVSWYSKTGKQLGQRSTSALGMVRFAIDAVGVHRVHVDTTGDPAGAAIDNLEFSAG